MMLNSGPLPADPQEVAELELIEVALEEMRERARARLLPFTLYSKPDYRVNWHHSLICRYLDLFVSGKIKRLLIMAPPRHGKSELVSRRLPAFILGKNPDAQIICASYADSLASRMNRDVQRIIDSPEYARLFPHTKLFGKGMRATVKGSWQRTSKIFDIVGKRGIYRSAGVGVGITGMGATHAIIDDPIKDQKMAESKVMRETVWEWYGSTLYSRLQKDGQILLTLTRWHEDDLAGRILKQMESKEQDAEQWTVLRLPALCEDNSQPFDPRLPGEALWPDEYSAARFARTKVVVGSYFFNALWQQRPAAREGSLINRTWFKYYKAAPTKFDRMIISVDLAQVENDGADYSVFQVWGKLGADKYLLHQVRDRMAFPAECQTLEQLHARFPLAYEKVVEAKSNGHAVVSHLKRKIPGLILFDPKTSKDQRLKAVSPAFEAGNVWYPHPTVQPWVHDNVEEIVTFPKAANDDTVDATTQALLRFDGNPHGEFPKDEDRSTQGERRGGTIVGSMKKESW